VKIGFYPGCSVEGGSREYKESCRALAKAFGIELEYIPDWNCCGASAAHNLNKELSLALPARILSLAEKAGMTDILVPCAACYNRLVLTQHELLKNEILRNKVIEVTELDFKGTCNIMNVVQWIEKQIVPQLPEKVTNPFDHKVACYYGCLLVRPHKVLKFDRPEDPQTMDEVMKIIGARPVDWAFKTECCGAGLSVSKTDVVANLSGKIVYDAFSRQAEALIVACPMCHSNLDMRRSEINNYLQKKINIPVIYITQAIGLAIGLNEKELGLHRHFVPVLFPEKAELTK
jgi:heterodisulfide reductase subunit B2